VCVARDGSTGRRGLYATKDLHDSEIFFLVPFRNAVCRANSASSPAGSQILEICDGDTDLELALFTLLEKSNVSSPLQPYFNDQPKAFTNYSNLSRSDIVERLTHINREDLIEAALVQAEKEKTNFRTRWEALCTSGWKGTFTEQQLALALDLVHANSMVLPHTALQGGPVGQYVFPGPDMLNHSPSANSACFLPHLIMPEEWQQLNVENGVPKGQSHQRYLHMHTIRSVKAGEELTISYTGGTEGNDTELLANLLGRGFVHDANQISRLPEHLIHQQYRYVPPVSAPSTDQDGDEPPQNTKRVLTTTRKYTVEEERQVCTHFNLSRSLSCFSFFHFYV
jgi:hypothetical protein